MKKVFIDLTVLCMICLLPFNGIIAQHQTFMGVELGKNPELFKYEIKKKGFYEKTNENDGFLYGKFLESNCRFWLDDKPVEKIAIAYRYDENMSYQKAQSIAEGVVMIICKELNESKKKYHVAEDVPCWGSVNGTLICVENGWYEVLIDGSTSDLKQGWRVWVRIFDSPNCALFKAFMQQSKRQPESAKNKQK